MWGGTLAPVDEQERDRLQPTQCLVKPASVEECQHLAEMIEKLLRSQPHSEG
jgi:hypothetical protein